FLLSASHLPRRIMSLPAQTPATATSTTPRFGTAYVVAGVVSIALLVFVGVINLAGLMPNQEPFGAPHTAFTVGLCLYTGFFIAMTVSGLRHRSRRLIKWALFATFLLFTT